MIQMLGHVQLMDDCPEQCPQAPQIPVTGELLQANNANRCILIELTSGYRRGRLAFGRCIQRRR